MIEFKPVTPQDKELLTSYLFPGERRDANLSIVNLCSWQFLTCSSFAVVDGLPVLRFCFDSARTYDTGRRSTGGGSCPAACPSGCGRRFAFVFLWNCARIEGIAG